MRRSYPMPSKCVPIGGDLESEIGEMQVEQAFRIFFTPRLEMVPRDPN